MLRTMKRQRYNAMEPVPAVTWLVVSDKYGMTIYTEELPPGTDPRMVIIKAMARSIRESFEVEELPSIHPLYFCRKGEERRTVTIARRHPSDMGLRR